MKKLFSLMLVLCLALSLAACFGGSEDNSASPSTITTTSADAQTTTSAPDTTPVVTVGKPMDFPADYHELLLLQYVEYYNEDSKSVEILYQDSFQNIDDYGRAILPDGNVVKGPFGFGIFANTCLEIAVPEDTVIFASGAKSPAIFDLKKENGRYYLISEANHWNYELQYTEDEVIIYDPYTRLPKYHYE